MGPLRPQGQMLGGGGMQGPTSPTTDIVSGINAFLQNYRAARDIDKQRNLEDFQRDIQMMQLGIPIDHKQMEKHAKGAGLPFDYGKQPSKQEIEQQVVASQAQQQGPEMMSRMAQGVQIPPLQFAPPIAGGMQPPPIAGGPVTQGAPAPATLQPPPQQPSGFSNWISQMQGMTQGKMQQAMLQQKVDTLKTNIALAAISDNPPPGALEMAMRTGALKDMPWDAQERLFKTAGIDPKEGAQRIVWAQTHGPETQRLIFDYAKYMSEKDDKLRDDAVKMAIEQKKDRPYVPWSLVLANSVAYLNKDLKTFAETQRLIESSPSAALIEKGTPSFAMGAPQRKESREERAVRTGERGAATAEGRLGLEREKFAFDQASEQFTKGWTIFSSKESSDNAKDAALKTVVDAANKMGMPLTAEETKFWQRYTPGTGVGTGERVKVGYGGEAAAQSKTLGATPPPPPTSGGQPWFPGMSQFMEQRGQGLSEAPPPNLPGGQGGKGEVGLPQLLLMTQGTRLSLREAAEMAKSMGYTVPKEVENAVLMQSLYGAPGGGGATPPMNPAFPQGPISVNPMNSVNPWLTPNLRVRR